MCKENGLLGSDCYGMVCSLHKDEWDTFTKAPNSNGRNFVTIATEFENYNC
jgi:hypothetical protein